jgi:hypothetical protein
MLLLSADDMLMPGALLRATSIMDSHPNVGLTYGMALKGPDVTPSLPQTVPEWQIITGSQFLEYMCSTGRNPVPTPSAIVRTEIQKAIGGYRSELPHTGDVEMWIRFAVHSDIGVIKSCQAFYRWHGNNMQQNYLRSVLGDLPELKGAFDRIFSTYSNTLKDAPKLRRAVSQRLAENAFWRANGAFCRGDLDSYRKCLDFAKATYPEIVSSSSWTRLQCKVFLGSKVWLWIKPWIDWARNESSCKENKPPIKEIEIIGRWPE